jgi:hypothetical protein
MRSALLSRALGATAAILFLVAGAACSDGTSTAPAAAPTAGVQADLQADVVPNDATAAAVRCWYFSFRGGGPFPNPAKIGDNVRQFFGLINLGWDRVLYGAIIQSEVLQGGRVIYTRTDYQPSTPDRARLLWTVPPWAPAGQYTVRIRAITGLQFCQSQVTPWSTYTLTVQ